MRNYQIPLAVATNYKSAGGLNLSPSLTDSLSDSFLHLGESRNKADEEAD